jgi:pilus assembly protein Flp/PilA
MMYGYYSKNIYFAIILMHVILWRKEVRHVLFLPKENGQGLVEYALILVFVAIVVIAILLLLGPIVGNVFSNVVSNL